MRLTENIKTTASLSGMQSSYLSICIGSVFRFYEDRRSWVPIRIGFCNETSSSRVVGLGGSIWFGFCHCWFTSFHIFHIWLISLYDYRLSLMPILHPCNSMKGSRTPEHGKCLSFLVRVFTVTTQATKNASHGYFRATAPKVIHIFCGLTNINKAENVDNP
ncbi:MAG: hypothetical protein ACFWT0_04545 [Bifidobacterium crudilactis]|jgi:hypothetical protein